MRHESGENERGRGMTMRDSNLAQRSPRAKTLTPKSSARQTASPATLQPIRARAKTGARPAARDLTYSNDEA